MRMRLVRLLALPLGFRLRLGLHVRSPQSRWGKKEPVAEQTTGKVVRVVHWAENPPAEGADPLGGRSHLPEADPALRKVKSRLPNRRPSQWRLVGLASARLHHAEILLLSERE